MNDIAKLIIPLLIVAAIIWGAPIVFKTGGNNVPEEMQNEIVECKKPDGSDYFTFVLGSTRATRGLFGTSIFLENPETGVEKRLKVKDFVGVYVCRKLGTDDAFASTAPKE